MFAQPHPVVHESLSSKNSGFKSRLELLAQRKHDRLHALDKFDLDGDGVVSIDVSLSLCFLSQVRRYVYIVLIVACHVHYGPGGSV